jgi:hypothetical protein
MLGNVASCYERANRLPDGEKLLREALARQKQATGAEGLETAGAMAVLGQNLLGQKKWTDADEVLRECLTIRQKQIPDDWRTSNARSMLGEALLGQKKFADAEPLLVQGYDGLQQAADRIPPAGKVRLVQAADRLVRLYEATDRPAQAAAARKKCEEAKKAAP